MKGEKYSQVLVTRMSGVSQSVQLGPDKASDLGGLLRVKVSGNQLKIGDLWVSFDDHVEGGNADLVWVGHVVVLGKEDGLDQSRVAVGHVRHSVNGLNSDERRLRIIGGDLLELIHGLHESGVADGL